MSQHPLLGRKLTPAEAEAYLGGDTMDLIRQQLPIVLLDRLGGEVSIPASEIDGTGRFTMLLQIDAEARLFSLKLGRMQ